MAGFELIKHQADRKARGDRRDDKVLLGRERPEMPSSTYFHSGSGETLHHLADCGSGSLNSPDRVRTRRSIRAQALHHPMGSVREELMQNNHEAWHQCLILASGFHVLILVEWILVPWLTPHALGASHEIIS